jgi:hypothetical protein
VTDDPNGGDKTYFDFKPGMYLHNVMNVFMDNYNLFEEEKKKHGSKKNKGKNENEIMTMVFNTSMIKLLPEYEIYNSILGKPLKELSQTYDESIIETIKDLLEKEDITYYVIKETIVSMLNI